jgi:hypothetical protein
MDTNQHHRELYRCRAVAAYAYECASKGIELDWLENESLKDLKAACYNSNYGKCFGGAAYSECSRTANTTCRDLVIKTREKFANDYNQETVCVPGCSCPEDQYYETISNRQQCVTKSSCSCYDIGSGRYYNANEKIKRACSTWLDEAT